jgi:hypothetical protein
MNNICTCGNKFMDAEDFRDHIPCPGNEQQIFLKKMEDIVINTEHKISKNYETGPVRDAILTEFRAFRAEIGL